MKKICISLCGAFIIATNAYSQDMHFSQYDENPSLVNPALTGANFVMRASVIYKDQWRSVTVPYKTYGASYDMKFKASSWDKVDPFRTKAYKKAFNRLAGGLAFYSDKAGDGNMGTNQANLSLATFVKAGDYSSFSLGLQGGIVQKTVDYSKFIFSNQYNGTTGYDQSIVNGEHFGSQSFVYPDFAAGLLWNYSKDEKAIGENNQIKADVGFGMFHINKPKQKFLVGTNEQLFSKYVIHGKLLMGIPHSNVALVPSILVELQGSSKEILGGMMFKYYLKEDSKYTGYVKRSSIGLGVSYRYKDAVIVSALLEMGHYAVGLCYDINTSALTKVSTLRGGPEIMLRFNSANPFLFQK
ncbi:MAG: PorP/SprF family type IX secretion system membrane protein [Bacteroidetes bacterium]|nr:PorP/SprF family type IX secretion system membrane protein [Bacteroidota bacterium]